MSVRCLADLVAGSLPGWFAGWMAGWMNVCLAGFLILLFGWLLG